MKRKVILTGIMFLSLIVTTRAQSTGTVFGLMTGGETENNVYVAVGQPFWLNTFENGYGVSAGLAQAQLERQHFEVTVQTGEGYTENGFSYPASTPVGTYSGKLYIPNGGSHHYDLLKTLKLKVKDALICGELVRDGDNLEYPTVAVAGYCWTQKNLRTQHYTDGTGVAKALVYAADPFPDVIENESVYGRLYTWYSAVNVPEGSAAAPIADANGFVQGICPVGWHIPTIVEMNALESRSAEDIRSTERWITPNSNTNSTGFSELPAGRFNASQDRFERLLTETDLWSTAVPAPNAATALSSAYYCDTPLPTTLNANDAVSVRCVKNY